MEGTYLIVTLFLVGLWNLLDANRLEKHVHVAEKMMLQGMNEETAMELSGCNFWDMPWYRRVLKNYPSVPTVE